MKRSLSWILTALLSSVLLVGTGAASSLAATRHASHPRRASLTNVTFVTNWYAEAEHGGFYAAKQLGIYRRMGLNVTIQPGGPQVQGVSLLAAGKVQFAMLNADQVLEARAQGLPIVALFATFQTAPQALMYHKGDGISSFKDLSGHTIYIYPGQPWWPYLIAKYHLTHYTWLTANGSIATFAANKNAVLQIYVTDEPYAAMQKGLKVGWLTIASSGFNIYQGLICTTESYLKAHPQVVKAFVQGSQLGWKAFLADPRKFAGAIEAANPQMTLGQIMYSATHEKPLILTGDALTHGIGWETAARYKQLEQQLLAVKFLKKPVNVDAAFTDRFLLDIR
jgi:NitT/TauT family transport system substrate-binding protein